MIVYITKGLKEHSNVFGADEELLMSSQGGFLFLIEFVLFRKLLTKRLVVRLPFLTSVNLQWHLGRCFATEASTTYRMSDILCPERTVLLEFGTGIPHSPFSRSFHQNLTGLGTGQTLSAVVAINKPNVKNGLPITMRQSQLLKPTNQNRATYSISDA